MARWGWVRVFLDVRLPRVRMLTLMFISPYLGFSGAAKKILLDRYMEFFAAEIDADRRNRAKAAQERRRALRRAAKKRWAVRYPDKYRAQRRRREARRRAEKAAKSDPDAHRLEMARRLAARKRIKRKNRKARERGAPGRLSRGLVDRLFALQQGRCAACRKDWPSGMHLDHIVPLAGGGSNEDENIQLLCPPCNLQKRDRDPNEFMRSCGFLI